MKKTITEQINLNQWKPEPETTNQSSNQTQKTDQTQTSDQTQKPKPKDDSKLQPGKQYKLELKNNESIFLI